MTYQKALESKKLYGNIIYDDGIQNHVIITPSLEIEWKMLLNYIKNDFNLYDDNLCKNFCSNNEYLLRAVVTEEGKKLLGKFRII